MSDSSRDYSLIPPLIRQGLDGYVAHGYKPGGFLCAVLSNDLADAVGRADPHSLRAIGAIVCYVYNELPSPCWGSREAVEAWTARGK